MAKTQLIQEIYEQLLMLYILDLEVELQAEKLKNVNPGIPYPPTPHPWQRWVEPQRTYLSPNTGDPYGPPWYITCREEK